jgi:putative nucleotidyltransferase with HDIG domain
VFALVSISTGLVIAELYEHAHIFGVVVSVLPLILFWYYFQLYAEIRGDLRSFVRALTSIIEEVDPYTRNHSYRVGEYAKRIARALRLTERDVETIEFAGLLHDLGKVREDVRAILRLDKPMNVSERRMMDTHATTGADIVDSIRALRGVSRLVRAHHERPDGRGYPMGLKGDEIPLGARIILVADTFDAMTSDRPYRKALPVERAVAELQKYAGAQFDASVVDAVVQLHAAGRFPVLYRSAGEENAGIVPLRATAS